VINKKTYNKLLNLHSDKIYTFLAKNLKDKNIAEDLTQECFLRLWKNSWVLNEEIAKSWLFKTAYHLMLNYIRDNKRLVFTESLSDLSHSKSSFETTDLLDHIFAQLSVEEKTIILLRDQEGYNYQEISKILSLTESNVKTKLFRARQHFKEVYALLKEQDKQLRYE
jgi:RNA polymerase sigma factor (sigma-70 family)